MIKTNTIEKILSFNDHWRPEDALFSVSELSGNSDYQLWLGARKTPRTVSNQLELNVNSSIGSGFHLLAEKVMKDEPDVFLERSFIYKSNDGYIISGTADLIRTNTKYGVVFEDYKTKGVFQAKKSFKGDMNDVVTQLSIYRLMYADEVNNGKDDGLSQYGLVNILVTGDTGYYSKADGGGKVEKYRQIPVMLFSLNRVRKFIEYKITEALKEEEPVNDCEAWRCEYCNYECSKRKNNEKG